MSARSRRLVVRADAQADLRSVLLYTRDRWGADQVRRYRTQLNQAMRSLRVYPERGRTRDEYFLGCRTLAVEQHVVFYYLTDAEVVIVRILHSNQDATGKLDP
jgi:toxin ParE1/3/4